MSVSLAQLLMEAQARLTELKKQAASARQDYAVRLDALELAKERMAMIGGQVMEVEVWINTLSVILESEGNEKQQVGEGEL